MLTDYILGFALCLGVGGGIGVHLGPVLTPTWYPRVLRVWGRKRNVRVEFVLGPGLRLREGPEVEVALGRLYVRLLSAIFVTCACFALSNLLLFHGPPLSRSTANSLAVAGLPLVATSGHCRLPAGPCPAGCAPPARPPVASAVTSRGDRVRDHAPDTLNP